MYILAKYINFVQRHITQIFLAIFSGFQNNIFLFKDLMNALFEYCKSEGMVLKVGVPNKNSFRYTIKIIKSKLVGYLPYYILPVRAFTLLHVKKLNFLNVFSF